MLQLKSLRERRIMCAMSSSNLTTNSWFIYQNPKLSKRLQEHTSRRESFLAVMKAMQHILLMPQFIRPMWLLAGTFGILSTLEEYRRSMPLTYAKGMDGSKFEAQRRVPRTAAQTPSLAVAAEMRSAEGVS